MANPQPDEYTKISNEIMDAFMRTNFTSHERRILDCILRKTYGWSKKTDRIAYSQFEESTQIDHRHIGRSLKSLKERNIIIVSGSGYLLEYGLQKDYEQWRGLKTLTSKHQTIKHEKKQKTPDGWGEFIKQKIAEYPELDIKAEMESCQLWYSEGKKKVIRPKSALNNWLKIAKEKKTKSIGVNNDHPKYIIE